MIQELFQQVSTSLSQWLLKGVSTAYVAQSWFQGMFCPAVNALKNIPKHGTTSTPLQPVTKDDTCDPTTMPHVEEGSPAENNQVGNHQCSCCPQRPNFDSELSLITMCYGCCVCMHFSDCASHKNVATFTVWRCMNSLCAISLHQHSLYKQTSS